MTETESTSEASRRSVSINREHIFERDDYTCQNCGEKYGEDSQILEIAHKQPLHEVDNPDDPDNLTTLCPTCHRKFDLGELGEQIASNLQQNYEKRAKARNHASTVEAFAKDSIEITKLNILIVSVAGTAITVLLQTNVIANPSTLANLGMLLGGLGLFFSTVATLWTYYSCRTSGTSSTAVDEILEGESDEDVSDKTAAVYSQNAKKMGTAIGLTLISVCSLIGGVGVAIV